MAFGLTPQGFVPMQQQDIITATNAALQAVFGSNINLGPESIFGQFVSIYAEREALLWQLAEAIYASQYPNGAEGTSVDNILALNNLKRLQPIATKTNPESTTGANGITLYGLVLRGVAGTPIPAGSIISNGGSPALSFTLDNSVVISPAQNAVESLFLSNTPNMGNFALSIVDPAGNTLTTPQIAYNTLANQTQITWNTPPASGNYFITVGNQLTPLLAYNASAATVQAAIQTLPGYGAVTVSGSSAAGFLISWGAIPQPIVQTNSTFLSWGVVPSSGSYQIVFNGSLTTLSIPYNATAAQMQIAINALTGFSLAESVTVVGTASTGYFINWGWTTPATVTFTANTTGQTITAVSSDTLDQPTVMLNSVQSAINNLYDDVTLLSPYTDVAASGFTTGFTFNFGANTPSAGQPSSGAQPQALMLVASNTLQNGSTVTNLNVTNNTTGAPAQAVGTATCTQTGANSVLAGTLNVIGTPVTGWTGVTNQLDCITGAALETDTEALIRRSKLLAAQANGPIQSIVEKVQEVTGVTAAIGFQNLTNAAQQVISFASVPVSGNFRLNINGQQTGNIAYNASSSAVQLALQALSGYANVLVTGNVQFGFVVDFNGSYGDQAQPLFTISNNTTGVAITPYFGRPPHSFEIVAEGGTDADVAKTIYGSEPAGIKSYGAPIVITTGSVTALSPSMTVASSVGIVVGQAIFGAGVANGATVVGISGTMITMSLPAIGTYASTQIIFNTTVPVTDTSGNIRQISFSRPTQITFYVNITMVTDQYNTPGVSSSGVNPTAKFNPQSISTIQSDITTIGNAVSIGGLVIGFGSSGLIGAFNSVPGIISYTMTFGIAPNPVSNANIQMQAEQVPLFESFNVVVSFT